MATGQGRASYILNSLKDILFSLEVLYHVHNTDKLHLFCSPQITYFKANTSELPNAILIVQIWGFFPEKKTFDRYCDGQLSVSAWAGQRPMIQPNTRLDVAVKVVYGWGSHPSSELQ